ncbi:MAG: ubiquinone/menaquinone biosynthesis methyltransferase [Candidatus Krumholzibacteriia bacterium]
MTDLPDIHHRDPGTGRVDDPEAHAQAVRGMFARISGVYDLMNHLLSLNLDRRWRRRVASRLDPDTDLLLDLCAGTGDLGLACLAAGRARRVAAVDFVPEMLAGIAGKRNAHAVGPVAGDGLSLPVRDLSVDAVVAGFGVRNLADPVAGVAEMKRVLRPGGQVLVLEFFRADPSARGQDRGPAAPVRWLLSRAVPAVGSLVARDHAAYSYLPGSMDRFLTTLRYQEVLREAGFVDVFVERMTFGIAHLVGGRLPR